MEYKPPSTLGFTFKLGMVIFQNLSLAMVV